VSARVDPRAPVVVGVAQSVRHPEAGDELTELPEPATMMVEALRLAGEDSGAGDRLLRAADSVRVVDTLSWRYRDTPGLVAEGETIIDDTECIATSFPRFADLLNTLAGQRCVEVEA